MIKTSKGTNYYGEDSARTAIGLWADGDVFIVHTTGETYLRTNGAWLQTASGADPGANAILKQTLDANSMLYAVVDDTPSALVIAANRFPARSSTGNIEAKPVTDAALTVLDDATVSAMLTTLGAAEYVHYHDMRMSSDCTAGDALVNLLHFPTTIAIGTWLVLDPYTVQCEVRKIVSVSETAGVTTVGVSPVLSYGHAAGDSAFVAPYGTINVAWFGATGDGSTDDTGAMQAAADAIIPFIDRTTSLRYAPVIYVSPGNYRCSTTWSIAAGVNVRMDGRVIYTGSANEPGIQVGDATIHCSDVSLKLAVVRANISDFSDENCVGIRLVRSNRCVIEIVEAVYFTVGVECRADGGGWVHNKTNLGRIAGNKIGVKLHAASLGGYVNDNLFYGGNISCGSSNPTIDRFGIVIYRDATSQFIPENNIFFKPSIEMGAPQQTGTASSTPVLIDNGWNNQILDIRDEDNVRVGAATNYLAVINNLSKQNIVTVAYRENTSNQISDTTTVPTTTYRTSMIKNSAPPATGTYGVGEIIYNSAPSAAGFIGWVCVTAGTPGTWKGFGSIEA